jgi:hypothetical protein
MTHPQTTNNRMSISRFWLSAEGVGGAWSCRVRRPNAFIERAVIVLILVWLFKGPSQQTTIERRKDGVVARLRAPRMFA